MQAMHKISSTKSRTSLIPGKLKTKYTRLVPRIFRGKILFIIHFYSIIKTRKLHLTILFQYLDLLKCVGQVSPMEWAKPINI